MKIFISLLILLFFVSICYADRICLEKSTGKLIEYQSGDAPLGTLIKNAINAGYKNEDIEEYNITKEEWTKIEEEQIKKPAKEKAKQKEKARKQKEEAIKVRLGLSDEDWANLKEALSD